jgi:hypothetical protein
VDSIQGVLRQFVRLADDPTKRHGQLVGERHYRARDMVGGGSAEASAAHDHGRQATALLCKYGGIDAFNALMTKQKRGLSLLDVLRQQDETHRRLIVYVESAPEELLTRETRFRRRLRLDTYNHYPKHAKAIRAWREQTAGLGLQEAERLTVQ